MGLDNSDICTEANIEVDRQRRRSSDQTKSINNITNNTNIPKSIDSTSQVSGLRRSESEHVSSTRSTEEVHQPDQPSQLVSQPTQLSQPLSQPSQPSQTLTPAQSQEENKRMLYSKYRFKQGSKLLQYIKKYTTRHQELYTLAEILLELKELIKSRRMFDEWNPSVIMCCPLLEEALNMKALHVTEIRELIMRQLILVEERSDPGENGAVFPPVQVPTPPPIMEVRVPNTKHRSRLAMADPGARTVTQQPPPPPRQVEIVPPPNSRPQPSQEVLEEPASRFWLKEKFYSVLKTLEDFDRTKKSFTYSEVTAYVSKYILSRKSQLFDARNIKLAIVLNDPLGEAFKVHAFHRTQVTTLIRSQLTYVDPKKFPEEYGKNSEHSGITVPGFPTLNRAASSPAELIADYCNKLKRSSPEEISGPAKQAKIESDTADTGSEVESGDDNFEVEYEIETGDEETRPLQDDNSKYSSGEDSDINTSFVAHKVKVNDGDMDCWADNEEMYKQEEKEEEEDKTKTKLKSEMNKCARCIGTSMFNLRYCSTCWLELKAWKADRPKNMKSKRARNVARSQRIIEKDYTDSANVESGCSSQTDSTSVDSQEMKFESEVKKVLEKTFSKNLLDSRETGSVVLVEESNLATDRLSAQLKDGAVSNLCLLCYQRPKNAGLIHGRICHQICCYPCAKILWKKQAGCPLCRRKIEKYTKVILG